LAKVDTGNAGIYSRNVRNYYTWADSDGASLHLKVKAGIIYDRLGPAKIDVYPAAEPEAKSVCHVEVAPDKQVHEVTLTGLMRGLNRIELSDRTAGTLIDWPDATPMTTVASTDQPTSLYGRWSMYFYVPRGTKTIGGYASGEGNLVDPAGQIVHTFDKAEVYFNIPVPPGQDGKLWKFTHSSGQRLLMTVPPCLARNADELLLPQEVIARDQPK
jgi:hypothetical protein